MAFPQKPFLEHHNDNDNKSNSTFLFSGYQAPWFSLDAEEAAANKTDTVLFDMWYILVGEINNKKKNISKY